MKWPFSREKFQTDGFSVEFRSESQYIELLEWIAALHGLEVPLEGREGIIAYTAELEMKSLLGLHGYLHIELVYLQKSGIEKDRQKECKKLLRPLAAAFKRRKIVLSDSGVSAAALNTWRQEKDEGALINRLAEVAILAETIHDSAKRYGESQALGFLPRPTTSCTSHPHDRETLEATMVGMDGALICAIAPLARPQFVSVPPVCSSAFQEVQW